MTALPKSTHLQTTNSADKLSLPKPEAVVFDWDNTLVDSHETIAIAINKMHEAMGLEPVTLDYVKNAPQRSMNEVFPEKFGENWKKARDIFNAHFDEVHIDKLKPKDGAHDLLKFIDTLDIPIFIVSNKSYGHLLAEVKALNWHEHFTFIRGSIEGQPDKPNPICVEHALSEANLSPDTHTVWFIGDSDIDAKCAVNSRCVPIIYTEKDKVKAMQNISQDIVFIDNLSKVKDLLANSQQCDYISFN